MRLAHVLGIGFLSLPARAELVEVDLLAPGDALVTRDTNTALDWLDLGNVTTGLSYDDIQAGTGGWLASGWRYATQAEVCVASGTAVSTRGSFLVRATPPQIPMLPLVGVATLAASLALAARRALTS